MIELEYACEYLGMHVNIVNTNFCQSYPFILFIFRI